MAVTLDGKVLFDENDLIIEPDSFSRSSIERTVPGLEGVLSIDLGQRSRKIIQKGAITAKSRALLDKRIEAISAFMDGDTHTLVIDKGRECNNLRMDIFKMSNERTSSVGVIIDYEIVYTQLF